MTGAILLGLILMVGGALLEWAGARTDAEADAEPWDEEPLLLRAFSGQRRFTRTSRLLQALGTVLMIIGVLALML